MPSPGSDPNPLPSVPDAGERDLYRLIINAALDAVVTIDDQGRVMDWNGRAEEIFGWPAADVLGRLLVDFLIPIRYRESHLRGMAHFVRTGVGPILRHRVEMYGMRRDGQEIPLELSISPAQREGGWIFIAFLRDLSEQRKAAKRMEMQNAVLRILTDSTSLDEMEAKILQAICQVETWTFGAFWRREGDFLTCTAVYFKPDAQLGDFRDRTLRARFKKGEGFPGWIWESKTSLYLNDYRSRELSPVPEAPQADLQSAYGFPVLVSGVVHGVFEFFGGEAQAPDPPTLEAIASIAGQIGLYMERKETEAALKESEARFRVLADNAPVLIWITDTQGNCSYVNRPWAEMTGISFHEAVHGGWERSIHPDDFGFLRAAFLSDMQARRPFRMEIRLRLAAGGYRWFLEHGIPRYTTRGVFNGYIGACVDIDESKTAREEMAMRERRFRALVENSTDAFAIYDLAGIVAYASASTENVLGYSDSEFTGMAAFSLVHPEDLPLVTQVLESLLTNPGVRMELQARVRHKDGSWRWVEGSTVNLSGDPLIGGILSNYRDVTEKKRATQEKNLAEDRLRQGQKMEAVGRLAGGIAHDFNNLLTSINGYSTLALEALKPEGQLKEFLQEILKSGERAAGLTRQLLAYSRKQTLAPKLWDLNEIIAGMEGMLRRIIGEDIDLAVKPYPQPCLGKLDRGQVEQILLNLVLNARDAMPKGGKLMLETANVEMNDSYAATHLDAAPGPYVMLAVSDTGTGMTEEIMRNLFEPFFTTKETGKGTGLGLSSVYGIAKQSGGSINVYSEPGMGSTFRVYLPRAVQDKPTGAEAPTAASANAESLRREALRGRENLLLVEDEESVLRFSVQALESLGYRVFTAANGREALGQLGREAGLIQLIITDVVMPDMGGQALADRVRVQCPDLPILFISGYTENFMAQRGLINAGEPFLQKPYSPLELAKKVREAMDRRPVSAA